MMMKLAASALSAFSPLPWPWLLLWETLHKVVRRSMLMMDIFFGMFEKGLGWDGTSVKLGKIESCLMLLSLSIHHSCLPYDTMMMMTTVHVVKGSTGPCAEFVNIVVVVVVRERAGF
jgi:hypothetical protein